MSDRRMGLLKLLTLSLCAAYFFFPNDDEFHVLGIGPTGARILVLDMVILVLMFVSIGHFRPIFKKATSLLGSLPLVLLFSMVGFSLARGIPEFAGLAIGEARWYLSAIVFVPFYLVYDRTWSIIFRRVLVAAVWHGLRVIGTLLVEDYRGESGGMFRVGGEKLPL